MTVTSKSDAALRPSTVLQVERAVHRPGPQRGHAGSVIASAAPIDDDAGTRAARSTTKRRMRASSRRWPLRSAPGPGSAPRLCALEWMTRRRGCRGRRLRAGQAARLGGGAFLRPPYRPPRCPWRPSNTA